MAANEKKFLRIGDVVTLFHGTNAVNEEGESLEALTGGWLCAEGQLGEDCMLTNKQEHIQDCLWEIHVQNQYSAQREYREALLISISDGILVPTAQDHSLFEGEMESMVAETHSASHLPAATLSALRDLQKAAANERRLNQKIMSMKIGKPLSFGDPFQLRHVKSGKFLTVSSNVLAKHERENMKVMLDVNGNALSYVGIMPRHQYDKEGQLITDKSEVFIRVHERSGEYIHTSSNHMVPFRFNSFRKHFVSSLQSQSPNFIDTKRNFQNTAAEVHEEINSSVDSTTWSINVFKKASFSRWSHDNGLLNSRAELPILAGHLITLQDPDSLSCLVVEQLPTMSKSRDFHPRVVMSPQFHGMGKNSAFLEDIDTTDATLSIGSHLLWLVERTSVACTRGGPIVKDSDTVILRNLNTGLYLHYACGGSIFAVIERDKATEISLHVAQASVPKHTRYILEDEQINIRASDGRWLGRATSSTSDDAEEENEEDDSDRSENENEDDLSAVNVKSMHGKGKVFSLKCEAKKVQAEAISFVVSSHLSFRVGIPSLFLGSDAVMIIKYFCDLVKNISSFNTSYLREAKAGMPFVCTVLEHLYHFLYFDHGDKGNVSISDSFMRDLDSNFIGPSDQRAFNIRQTIMSEQGIIYAILSLLELADSKSLNKLGKTAFARSSSVLDVANNSLLSSSRRRISNAARSKKKSVSLQKKSVIASPPLSEPSHMSNATESVSERGRPRTSMMMSNMFNGLIRKQQGPQKVSPLYGRSMSDRAAETPTNDFMAEVSGGEENKLATIGKREMAQSPSHQITNLCLLVLLQCVTGHQNNQMQAAERFPVILNQLKGHQIAVVCVEEMLRNNLQILQTMVRQREMDIFVRLLAESDMNVTLLRLIQSTCSCPRGVDATQRMVATSLFGVSSLQAISEDFRLQLERRETIAAAHRPARDVGYVASSSNKISSRTNLMITILEDQSNLRTAEWTSLHKFAPGALSRSSHTPSAIMGYSLVKKGMPELWVSWTVSEANHTRSMKTIFGAEDRVSLSLFCKYAAMDAWESRVKMRRKSTFAVSETPQISQASPKKISNRKKSVDKFTQQDVFAKKRTISNLNDSQKSRAEKLKSDICEYLIRQLYVVADVCLDRNYLAIEMMEGLYKYEVLVTILKLPDVPNRVKAPVCRMLKTIYVDREPQTDGIYPRYVRKSGQYLQNNFDEDVSNDENSSKLKFALLQQMIFKYLEKYFQSKSKTYDEFSTEMTSLLCALFSFGYYDNIQRRNELFFSILGILGNRMSVSKQAVKSIQPPKLSAMIADPFKLISYVYEFFARRFSGFSSEKTTESMSSGKNIQNLTPFLKPKNGDTEIVSFVYSASKYWIDFTDSVTGSLLIISIVVLATVVVLIQLIHVDSSMESDLDAFNTACIVFFAVEILLRICTFVIVNKSFTRFFYSDSLNTLDIVLVLTDLGILFLNYNFSYLSSGRVVRVVRIIRLIRLVRILRTVRLMRKLRAAAAEAHRWKLPNRYLTTTTHEVLTVVSILKTISMIYDRIQDSQIDRTVKSFFIWSRQSHTSRKDQTNTEQSLSAAIDIYRSVVVDDNELLNKMANKMEPILLDMLMYSDSDIVQEALNLLIIYKSQRVIYFDIADRVQIILSSSLESKCDALETSLREIKRLAEMYEMWSELHTTEDQESAGNLLQCLEQLIQSIVMKNEDSSYDIRSEVLIDEEVQTLLRNLNAMPTLVFVQETMFQGGREELKPQALKIIQICNQLIFFFVLNCKPNQDIAFKYIKWFVDTSDLGFGCSKVLRAMLDGNTDLIKQCPTTFIPLFAQRIIAEGHKPECLDLLLGMTEFSDLMDMRVTSVELEVSSYLTNREWKRKILLWCCGPQSDAYEARKSAMARCVQSYVVSLSDQHSTLSYRPSHGISDLRLSILPVPNKLGSNLIAEHYAAIALGEEDLTSDLQYHVKLLALLSCCNLGPKLQAVYPTNDILYALLDSSTILPVKLALGKLLIEAIKINPDKVEKLSLFWDFLEEIASTFESLPQRLMERVANPTSLENSAKVRINEGRWLEICSDIFILFFDFFDPNSVIQAYSRDQRVDISMRSTIRIDDVEELPLVIDSPPIALVRRLSKAIVEISQNYSRLLGSSLTQHLELAQELFQDLLSEIDSEWHNDGEKRITNSTKGNEPVHVDTNSDMNALKMIKARHHKDSQVFKDDQQLKYRTSFKAFMKMIHESNNPEMKHSSAAFFEAIPSVNETHDSEARFEPLVKKLSEHLSSMIRKSPSGRSLPNDNLVKCTSWYLQSLHQLLINKSLKKRTREVIDYFSFSFTVSNTRTDSMDDLRATLNENGVVNLCLNLLALGIDKHVRFQAMALLNALLDKVGGCEIIQVTVNTYLKETESTPFFEMVDDMITLIKEWCGRESGNAEQSADNFPPELIVLDFLQLLCEGGCLSSALANKVTLSQQDGNSRVVDILGSLASCMTVISKFEDGASMNAISVRVLRTITKLNQGPCVVNQEVFVLQTELLVSVNRILRMQLQQQLKNQLSSGDNGSSINSNALLDALMDSLLSLVECQDKNSLVFERLSETIELGVLHVVMMPNEMALDDGAGNDQLLDDVGTGYIQEMKSLFDKYGDLLEMDLNRHQAKYLAFTELIGQVGTSDLTAANTFMDMGLSCVEVIFNGSLQQVYFQIPESVRGVLADAKTTVLAEMPDQCSQELKLRNFTQHCKYLFKDSLHQQLFTRVGISNISLLRISVNRAMFLNAFVMTGILLAYYEAFIPTGNYPNTYGKVKISTNGTSGTSSYSSSTSGSYTSTETSKYSTSTQGKGLYLNDDASTAFQVLIIFQVVLASGMVVLIILSTLPVKFSYLLETSQSLTHALQWTLLDPSLLWYFVYLILTVLSLEVDRLFVSALLLDWVMIDATTRDLIKAILYPMRQLWATLVIMLIMLNIFSGMLFVFYRHEFIDFHVFDMWESLKLCISYGFRGEYGVGYEMYQTIGDRIVLDFVFYFVIIAILRHIFFAIIVDTFGKLREIKFERDSVANNTCFICGVDKHDFLHRVSAKSESQVADNGDDGSRAVSMGTFTKHCNTTHNTMNYFHFIVSIWEQPCSEDNGVYSYVRHCLAVGDVRWFPIGVVSELMSDSLSVAEKAAMPSTRTQSQTQITERPTSSKKNSDPIAVAAHAVVGNGNERMRSQSKDVSDATLANQLKKIQVQMKQLSQMKEETEKDDEDTKPPPTESRVDAGEGLLSSLHGFKSSLSSMLQRLDGLDQELVKEPPDSISPDPLPTQGDVVVNTNLPIFRRARNSSTSPSPTLPNRSPNSSPTLPNRSPSRSPSPALPNRSPSPTLPNRSLSPSPTVNPNPSPAPQRPHSAKTPEPSNSLWLGQIIEARQRPKTAGPSPKATWNTPNSNLSASPNLLTKGPSVRNISSNSSSPGMTVSGLLRERSLAGPSMTLIPFVKKEDDKDKDNTT